MKKRQRKVRLIRAAIQLVFFIFYPALFSTAFAGVKSIFQAIAAHQQIAWNSFLDVTGLLLLVTILFGRHFCGYACAFGSLGDAMYELTVFIRQKVFHKKGRHGYPETFCFGTLILAWIMETTGENPTWKTLIKIFFLVRVFCYFLAKKIQSNPKSII